LVVGMVVDVSIEGVHPLLSDIEAELLFLGDVYERARSRNTAGEAAVVHISLGRSFWKVLMVWIMGSMLVSRVLFASLLFPLIGKNLYAPSLRVYLNQSPQKLGSKYLYQ
jgi:hypothetical protein